MKKKELHNFLFFLILNCIFLILVVKFFFPTYFESNDDFAMGRILSGVYGDEYRQCLIFTNVILGFILSVLSKIIVGYNWYVISQYILIIVGLSALVKLIADRKPLLIAFIINLISWYVFAFDFVRGIQFTRTAGFVMLAGFVCLWMYVVDDSILDLVIGAILFIYGFMLRYNCIFLILPFAATIIIYTLLDKKVNIKRMICTGSCAIVICVLLLLINNVYYSKPEWKEYNDYNSARAQVMDNNFPEYEGNETAYNNAGVSYNDVLMLDNWSFADNKVFDTDTLKKVGMVQKNNYIPTLDVALLVSECKGVLFIIWLVLLLLCIANNNKKIVIFSVIVGIGTLLYIEAFVYIGRLVERVIHVVWLSAIITYIYMLIPELDINKYIAKYSEKAVYTIISAVFLASFGMFYFVFFKGYNKELYYSNDEIVAVEMFSEDSEHVYVCNTLDFLNTCFVVEPYKCASPDYMNNVITTGGWECNAPFYNNKLKRLEIDNVLEDLVLHDNVYYVQDKDKDLNILLTYYREHYGYDCQYDVVKEGYVFNVYRIYCQ